MNHTKEEAKAILVDLDLWLKERGVAIGGCGCCGSPYLLYKNEAGTMKAIDKINVGSEEFDS